MFQHVDGDHNDNSGKQEVDDMDATGVTVSYVNNDGVDMSVTSGVKYAFLPCKASAMFTRHAAVSMVGTDPHAHRRYGSRYVQDCYLYRCGDLQLASEVMSCTTIGEAFERGGGLQNKLAEQKEPREEIRTHDFQYFQMSIEVDESYTRAYYALAKFARQGRAPEEVKDRLQSCVAYDQSHEIWKAD